MSSVHTTADCDEYHDVVRDFDDEGTTLENPTITVLCGSTRFAQTFREQNLNLTLAGHIVLSIGCDMRSDAELFVGIDADGLSEIKGQLDWLHRRKIDLADEVLVLNIGGYIGDSTRAEIIYATKRDKSIRYLEPDSAPIAGDTYGEWTIDAYRIPGNDQDARVVLKRSGSLVREFSYPAYKVWTLLAHWREAEEVNEASPMAEVTES